MEEIRRQFRYLYRYPIPGSLEYRGIPSQNTGVHFGGMPDNTRKFRSCFRGTVFYKIPTGLLSKRVSNTEYRSYNHTMPTTTRQCQKERKCYVLLVRVISFGSKNTDFSLDTPRGWSGSRWWVGVGLGRSSLRNNENKENGIMLSISRSTTVFREVAVSPREKSQLCQAHNTKTKNSYVR